MADASTPVIGTVRAAMSSMTIGGTGTMIATVIAGKITTIITTTANHRGRDKDRDDHDPSLIFLAAEIS